jgi:hypothetical protein
VGFAHTAGTKQQQVLRLQQPGVAAGEDLELLPVLGFEVLVIKAIQSLLPREMRLAQ